MKWNGEGGVRRVKGNCKLIKKRGELKVSFELQKKKKNHTRFHKMKEQLHLKFRNKTKQYHCVFLQPIFK